MVENKGNVAQHLKNKVIHETHNLVRRFVFLGKKNTFPMKTSLYIYINQENDERHGLWFLKTRDGFKIILKVALTSHVTQNLFSCNHV